MQLRNVMAQDLEVIGPDATLQEAGQKMRAKDVGLLPVCDGDRLTGMLTDRDITVRATAEGRDPTRTTVREVMTPDVAFAFEDQTVQDAARVMEEWGVRRLPVLNRDRRLVGIISLADLAVGTGDEKMAGEVLKRLSEPAKP